MIRTLTSPAWKAWLACTLIGSLLIALPDPDRRLFSISNDHGPGIVDFAGAVVLLAGWVLLDAQIWRGRHRLRALPRRRLLLLAVVAGAGALLVAWSVSLDAGVWWLLGAALMAGTQLIAAALATARP